MHLRLPDPLPASGVAAELRFRRMPRAPCVLRVSSPRAGPIAQFDMYGRGEGSTASQEVVINVYVDAATIAERGLRAGDTLDLVTESLEGDARHPAGIDLELAGVTFRTLKR